MVSLDFLRLCHGLLWIFYGLSQAEVLFFVACGWFIVRYYIEAYRGINCAELN